MMKLRCLVLLATVGAVLAVATWAGQENQGLVVLDWAAKAKMPVPGVAVLIEMGGKDRQPTGWSGRATVQGARVVHREGYHFRDADKLVGQDAWEASSRRPIRTQAKQAGKAKQIAKAKTDGVVTVGVVLHLADIQPGAVLTLEPKDREFERATVSVSDVLTGKAVTFADGRGAVRRISVATPVAATKAEEDFPAAAYGPDGTLWVAYVSYPLLDETRRVQDANYRQQPADFRSLYTPAFRDQLFVRAYRDGKWGEPIPVTGASEDLARCGIAAESNGEVWVAYCANRGGAQSLQLARVDQRAGESPVTVSPAGVPHLSPAVTTLSDGRLRLSAMGWAQGSWNILTNIGQGGKPAGTLQSFAGPAAENRWNPALAAGPGGKSALAYDIYHSGDYDVNVVVFDGANNKEHVVAGSSKFEARPSIAYDARGRLWIAYEEGPELWGKDSGALAKTGNPLYSDRNVRVVCLDTDGTLKRPTAELPTSNVGNPGSQFAPEITQNNERATRYASPRIGLDGKGRVWLTYRQNFGTRITTRAGNYWHTFARRLDGDRWSEPIELHHSDGLLDSRPPMLPHPAGGLIVIHNTDGRHTTPETLDNQVYMSVVDLPGEPVEPRLVPHDAGRKDPALLQRALAESRAVDRMRNYRMEVGGKTYRPLRGEFHRHTDISWDGAADGSLEDMFRYAVDAAGMDWIGNGDHDNGGGREYTWWLTQKLTDAYHVKGTFTPMFTYERSVAYPMGHRNCMFVKRGVRTLPRLAPPAQGEGVGGVHPDDTKMLYRYLKELDGICASHTSATTMGTDWRDNDPQVEPIVEIYQGDRMSYEHEAAPRAGYDPQSGDKPANIAGWRPDGFIDRALRDKGIRFGFQSSSDHWSTHISYCVALAERHDREAILDALKKRHCYGATDDIVLDVRSGMYIMGDEFKTTAPPTLQMTVAGTGPIARITIMKDSRVAATLTPGQPSYTGTWTDPTPTAGVHFYYVRVEQADGQLAWGSPMWIDYGK
jgi:hypothetical protein